MTREGRDVISMCCMKSEVGNVVSDADSMKDICCCCHGQVCHQVSQDSRYRGSLMHELIPPVSAIDPLVTSQLGVCVSHLVVKLHSLYRCCLVRRTPYACSPAIDGSVLIVAGRECIVVFGSVYVPRPILGVGTPSTSRIDAHELSSRIYRVCVQIPEAFLPDCAASRKNSCVMSRVESLLHGSRSWLLSCDAMTDVVLLQTVHKVLRREHICVVFEFQCEGLLVEMVNTGHLVSSGHRPQSRILCCLYILKARVTCVSAPDWCCIACDRVKSLSPVPRTIPPALLAYCFSCRSYLSATLVCMWWSRPEKGLSIGKLESTHPSRTGVKKVFLWSRFSCARQC